MTMSAALRKLMLFIHISLSVGWIGSVLAYLALVLGAMNLTDMNRLGTVWIALKWIGDDVILPLSFTSLLTGIIMALGTKWGLFRHYWVLLSFALTLLAFIILFQHMQTVRYMASIAIEMNSSRFLQLRDGLGSEFVHAGLALLLLLVVQGLNVYKPRGLTAYGWRKQQEALES